MTRSLIVAYPGSEPFAERLSSVLDWEIAPVAWHRFPDSETGLRFDVPVRDATIAVVASLDRPDAKIAGLAFCAATARELGARRIGLVAPYLAYMRQDRRFRDGEAVSARIFPHIIGQWFDWLATADPHLHRIHDLAEIYTMPTTVIHCASSIGKWIAGEVADPLIVGPDEESAQWVAAIAAEAGAPHVVLRKIRYGDRSVEISVPDLSVFTGRIPVLVDDIISTGQSMAGTIGGLRRQGFARPCCVAVHPVLAEGAETALREAGISGLASCNTIAHSTNRIDVTGLFAGPVRELSDPSSTDAR